MKLVCVRMIECGSMHSWVLLLCLKRIHMTIREFMNVSAADEDAMKCTKAQRGKSNAIMKTQTQGFAIRIVNGNKPR